MCCSLASLRLSIVRAGHCSGDIQSYLKVKAGARRVAECSGGNRDSQRIQLQLCAVEVARAGLLLFLQEERFFFSNIRVNFRELFEPFNLWFQLFSHGGQGALHDLLPVHFTSMRRIVNQLFDCGTGSGDDFGYRGLRDVVQMLKPLCCHIGVDFLIIAGGDNAYD